MDFFFTFAFVPQSIHIRAWIYGLAFKSTVPSIGNGRGFKYAPTPTVKYLKGREVCYGKAIADKKRGR
jgi:hypothetical protein